MGNGPCQTGAYCYPVFSGGYKQTAGQIVAGQVLPGQIVGVGNIVGFVCNTAPVGKPGEKFWSGACPGTWGPNGPFYPSGSAPQGPQPQNNECIPKNPPPAPAGYRLIWLKGQWGVGTGKFVWRAHYTPINSPYKTAAECPCGKPSSPAPAKPPAASGPITPSPVTQPTVGDGCGPITGSGGEAARKLYGHDMGEHFEGSAVSANLVSQPVHDAATAAGKPDWTKRPEVRRNAQGIYQIWDGTADGNLALLPPELHDYHAFGDNQTAGAKYPANISGHGLLILSGARATPAHGDRPNGYLSHGLAHKTKRTPVSGFYWSLADGVLTLTPTDASADADTSERRVVVDANLQARADVKVPAASNPNTGTYASSTLWAYNDAGTPRPYFGASRLALYSELSAGSGDISSGSNLTSGRVVKATGTKQIDTPVDLSLGYITADSADDTAQLLAGPGKYIEIRSPSRVTIDVNGTDELVVDAGKISVAGTIELGHASDTTLARLSAGDLSVEGNRIYRAGGTDVPITDGGTGASDAPTARTNLGAIGGSTGSTDNAILRADGTGSATVQTSSASVDDSGNVAAPNLRNTLHFPPGQQVANLTAVTAFSTTLTNTYAVYLGKARAAITTVSVRCRVTTAYVSAGSSSAYVAIAKGTPSVAANASLTVVGTTDVASTFNSTGQKTVAVTVSGVDAGDELWAVFSNKVDSISGSTAFQLRGCLADDLQTGQFQTTSTAVESWATPQSNTLAGATVVPPWLAVEW